MQVGGGDIYDVGTQDQSSPFYFQQRRGRLDIRSVAQIDVDRIVRDVDIDLLQTHLENLTFNELKEGDLRYLTDPQVIKLFRTSQLMIEYLLFVQDHLTTNLQQLANKYIAKKRWAENGHANLYVDSSWCSYVLTLTLVSFIL
jgi:hypothetical protein